MNAPAAFMDAIDKLHPAWAVVLGSGLGCFVESAEIVAAVPFAQMDGLPISRVPGHSGRFVIARVAGIPILVAQGRVHLYEGWTAAEVTAAVRLIAQLGARRLVLTNAAGSLNPAFSPGTWMMIRDHLNLTGTTPLLGGPHFIDMSEVYSRKLRAHLAEIAARNAIVLHEGVYAGLLGPQYETRAEILMLQRLGADAVGMSTVLEAIQARALGLEIAAFSCLTNWAAGLSDAPLGHEEVLAVGNRAAAELVRLLTAAIVDHAHDG